MVTAREGAGERERASKGTEREVSLFFFLVRVRTQTTVEDTCLRSCLHFLTLLFSISVVPSPCDPTGETRGQGAPTLGLSSLNLGSSAGPPRAGK